MEWSNSIKDRVNEELDREFEQVAWGKELKGGNDDFAIMPHIAFTVAGTPYPVYGIFNRTTGVCEADTGQYKTAKDFVVALTAAAKGESLPGLGVGAKKVDNPAKGNDGPKVH